MYPHAATTAQHRRAPGDAPAAPTLAAPPMQMAAGSHAGTSAGVVFRRPASSATSLPSLLAAIEAPLPATPQAPVRTLPEGSAGGEHGGVGNSDAGVAASSSPALSSSSRSTSPVQSSPEQPAALRPPTRTAGQHSPPSLRNSNTDRPRFRDRLRSLTNENLKHLHVAPPAQPALATESYALLGGGSGGDGLGIAAGRVHGTGGSSSSTLSSTSGARARRHSSSMLERTSHSASQAGGSHLSTSTSGGTESDASASGAESSSSAVTPSPHGSPTPDGSVAVSVDGLPHVDHRLQLPPLGDRTFVRTLSTASSETSSSGSRGNSMGDSERHSHHSGRRSRTPRLLSVQTVPLSLKDRTQSAEGVLLAVQSKHQEAVAQIAAHTPTIPPRKKSSGVACLPASPSLGAFSSGEEDEVAKRTTPKGETSPRPQHRRGRSEFGLTISTDRQTASAGPTRSAFPFSGVVTVSSPTPLSSPLEAVGSAATARAPAAASLRRSQTTSGISAFDSDGPLSRQQQAAAEQQRRDEHARMQSFRDLVGAGQHSATYTPGGHKRSQTTSLKFSSAGRVPHSIQGSSTPDLLSGPVIPPRRPRLSMQNGFSSASSPSVPTNGKVALLRDEGSLNAGGASLVRSHSALASGKQTSITIETPSDAAYSRPRARSGLQPPTTALEAKVVILGSQGVGKTSLVHRYTTGQFNAGSMPSTIGASFATKRLIVDGTKVRLQLWDTAGQERFRSMAPMYYRGSHAAVIVYDITNRKSLDDIKSWIEELRNNMGEELAIHVVGAKADLASARQVTLAEARQCLRVWAAASIRQNVPAMMVTPPTRAGSRVSNFTSSLSMTRLSFHPSGGVPASGFSNDPEQSPLTDEQAAELAFWNSIDVSEVSSKDNSGIEDVFFHVTKRLVARKAAIERERARRERDSIMLTETSASAAPKTDAARQWSCCAS